MPQQMPNLNSYTAQGKLHPMSKGSERVPDHLAPGWVVAPPPKEGPGETERRERFGDRVGWAALKPGFGGLGCR